MSFIFGLSGTTLAALAGVLGFLILSAFAYVCLVVEHAVSGDKNGACKHPVLVELFFSACQFFNATLYVFVTVFIVSLLIDLV